MIDEEKTITQTLYAFIIFGLISSVISFAASVVMFPGQLTADGLGSLVGIFTSTIVLGLLRIKQFTLPRFIIPTIAYLTATYFIYTGSTIGIRDDGILIYTLAVVLAGLLLGNRGVIVFGVLSLLAVEGSIYAEINGFLVNHIDQNSTSYATFISVGMLYILTFSMMYILVNSLRRNLSKVRADQQALFNANRELQNIRTSLEGEVRERTAMAQAAQYEAEAARRTAEIQVWLVTGQAQLAEKMRGDLDSTTLANNMVGHICHYTGAQAGVFFLLDGGILHLLGSYAYATPTAAKITLRMGEGLIGQAARENAQLILHEIPEDAVQITSGLGETPPRQLLIAPLEVAGKVIGVLELATLNEFTPAHQAFIALSSESIAIAFQTAKTRERIESLLLESQRQAEELKAQEEELRSASDELQLQAENRGAVHFSADSRSSQQ